ncbi:MAG TPA: DUF1684 domain-containing protein [Bryobacteraceae bacterium]|nr:DUF1684 domain-containing protein [Bryobacteraceae bacterium]
MNAAVLLSIAVAATFAAEPVPSASAYSRSIAEWRNAREAPLKADDGWLTVVGLFWLDPGANVAGASNAAAIVLPPGSAPARTATFTLAGDQVQFRAEPGVRFTLGGRPVTETTLRPDTGGNPDVLTLGTMRLILLKRGERYAIRVKDNASPARRRFAGLRWYPADPTWRITARFTPYPAPRKIAIQNVTGATEQMESPGFVEFTREGKTYRLEPIAEGSQLFFVFRDATSGKTTYGAGRFLYADAPKGETVLLDFNKSENPPCAFTPYATCPLPPRQNRLALPVTAGEMKYPGTDH